MTEQRRNQRQLIFQLTSEEAHKALKAWCRDNGYYLDYCLKWTRWLDLSRPCWSTRALVVRKKSLAYLELGVQVYDEGEVLTFPMPW
jgi:hypothetical protein